jgi:sigma-E factor negative regulatory protein RseC
VIEEQARVVQADGHGIWVETQRRSACGQCSANKGCGTAVIGKVVGNRRNRVQVLDPQGVGTAVGEEVVIGIQEQALVRGSMAVYLLPLLSLFLFGLLGQTLAGQLGVANAEGLTILCSILGLAVGFAWVRFFSKAVTGDSRYQPVLLRRATPTVSIFVPQVSE